MKLPCSVSKYSDNNLIEASEEVVKEDDRAVLLEGGALQSASPKSRISSSASSIFRFLMMDEACLIENRLTLRAMYYPLLNILLTTSIYIAISYRLFDLTNIRKSAFVPAKGYKRLLCNLITAAVVSVVL